MYFLEGQVTDSKSSKFFGPSVQFSEPKEHQRETHTKEEICINGDKTEEMGGDGRNESSSIIDRLHGWRKNVQIAVSLEDHYGHSVEKDILMIGLVLSKL